MKFLSKKKIKHYSKNISLKKNNLIRKESIKIDIVNSPTNKILKLFKECYKKSYGKETGELNNLEEAKKLILQNKKANTISNKKLFDLMRIKIQRKLNKDKNPEYMFLFKKDMKKEEVLDNYIKTFIKALLEEYKSNSIPECSGMMIGLLKIQRKNSKPKYYFTTSESIDSDTRYKDKITFLKSFLKKNKNYKLKFILFEGNSYIKNRESTRPHMCFRPFVKQVKNKPVKCNSGSLCCESKLFYKYHNMYKNNKPSFGCIAFWLNKNGNGHKNYRYKDSDKLVDIKKIFAYPCPGCVLNYNSYLNDSSCYMDNNDIGLLIEKCYKN